MRLTLELSRTERPDEAFLQPEGATDYVLRTEGGGAETATLDWSRELHADLDAVRRPGRDPAVVQRLGNRLRRFLAPAGWAKHEAAIAAASERGEPVCITLRASAAELYGLPWELLTLKSTGQHLGELPDVLLRYAWPDSRTRPEEPSPLPEGGRILVGWSAAAGGIPLKPHLDAIGGACARGDHAFDPSRDVIDGLSLDRLASALDDAPRSGQLVTVLHLLCHGGEAGSSYGLCWDADDGSGDRALVDAARLRQILAPHAGRIRLVVLSACDSGNAGRIGNHLGSVAQNLHQAGVQAVIASRFPLSAEGSSRFAQTFYEALLAEPASVEQAFLAGRRRLARDPQSLDWAALTLHARPEDGDDTRPIAVRPYRGLLAFHAAHSRFFFGRQAERDEALSDLAALREGGKPRLLVVAGASGTGKSSVVLAGVIPALVARAPGDHEPARGDEIEALQRTVGRLSQLLGDKRRSGAVQQALQTLAREAAALAAAEGGWEVVVTRPGSEPAAALEAALARRLRPELPLLLVIDQLEEIFTHTADPAARQAYVRRLWALASEPGGPSVIATLRVDFLGQCGELSLDAEAGLRLDAVAYDEDHRVFVAQMKPAQMREAVEEPARRVGLALDPGLAARMIADVGVEPGALALLEYTLDLLWQRRAGRTLSTERYEELGGVFGALERMADQVLAGLDEAQREAARRLLPRLVGVGESGAGDTRQRVPVARLLPADPELRARCEEVLRRFVDARLLTRGEEGGEVVVEVAHEALIRRWKTLGAWLAEDRARLSEIAKIERWSVDFKGHGAVLRGAQLGYARQVRDQQEDTLSADAAAMIAASEEAEREEAAARQKRDEDERRRLRRIAVAALAAAAVALVLGAAALNAREKAERSQHKAENAKHIAAATALYAARHYLWAARALHLTDEEARGEPQWRNLAQQLPLYYAPDVALDDHEGFVERVAWSPDGERVATASRDGKARVFGRDGSTLATLVHGSRVHAVAWGPKGDHLATGAEDGVVRIWSVGAPQGELLSEASPGGGAVASVAWSHDGALLAVGSHDGSVTLWKAGDAAQLIAREVLLDHDDAVSSVGFSSDDRRLVSASLDHSARVAWIDGGSAPIALEHPAPVNDARFDARGTRIVTACADHQARIFPADGAGDPLVLSGHLASVNAAAWGGDAFVFTAADDNTARIWSADDGSRIDVLRHHTADVSSLDVVEGRARGAEITLQLATGAWDRSAALWTIDGMSRPIFPQPTAQGGAGRRRLVTWSPDGARALTASADGTLEAWENRSALPAHVRADGELAAAAFDGSGRRLLLASGTKAAIWTLDGAAEPLATLEARSGRIAFAAWSPDSRRVALASGATAELWNLDTPSAPEITLRSEVGGIQYVTWSADGRRVLTASGTIAEVWSTDAPGARRAVLHHARPVTSAAFSPAGDGIIVGTEAATWVWTGDMREPAGLHLEHDGPVVSLSFDASGRFVAAVSDTGAVRLCTVSPRHRCDFDVQGEVAQASRAMFSQDQKELIVLGSNGVRWSMEWITDPKPLASLVDEERRNCIPAEIRESHLGEDEATARQAYEACRKAGGPAKP
ncbi:CHAT domain-containing protein [Sorangium sp. So ce375]|uniref:nSTAND1 domain-containing NTPase n=1 Tax=Sorangium sp. So ce375 TaxID=3133306 RepID=UPI003F5AEB6C